MINRFLLGLTGAAFASLVALPAQATFFADRASFDAAAGVLPTEDFENTLVGSGGITACSNSFNAATNDGCFAPGGILPGITLSSVQNTGGMVVINTNIGLTSAAVGPNTFADNLSIAFGPGVNAVGLDLFSPDGASSFSVSVLGLGGLIAMTTVSPLGGGSSAFFGTIENQPILELLFQSLSELDGEIVDDIAFGSKASTVPEPASLALLVFGLTGIAGLRRRKTKARA